MSRLGRLLRLRDSRAEEEAEAVALEGAWTGTYRIVRDGRRWGAVHLPSGGVVGPAKTVGALSNEIRADYRIRPAGRPR